MNTPISDIMSKCDQIAELSNLLYTELDHKCDWFDPESAVETFKKLQEACSEFVSMNDSQKAISEYAKQCDQDTRDSEDAKRLSPEDLGL